MQKKSLNILLHNRKYFDYFSPEIVYEDHEAHTLQNVIRKVNHEYFPEVVFDFGVIFTRVNPEVFSWERTEVDFLFVAEANAQEVYLFTKVVSFGESLIGGSGLMKQVQYIRRHVPS